VLDKELVPEGHAKGEHVRPEYVVAAVGAMRTRSIPRCPPARSRLRRPSCWC
jgi:aspartyl-tRNA synthetase